MRVKGRLLGAAAVAAAGILVAACGSSGTSGSTTSSSKSTTARSAKPAASRATKSTATTAVIAAAAVSAGERDRREPKGERAQKGPDPGRRGVPQAARAVHRPCPIRLMRARAASTTIRMPPCAATCQSGAIRMKLRSEPASVNVSAPITANKILRGNASAFQSDPKAHLRNCCCSKHASNIRSGEPSIGLGIRLDQLTIGGTEYGAPAQVARLTF